MHKKSTYLLLLSLLFLSSFTVIQHNGMTSEYRLLTSQNVFEAGHTIILRFSTKDSTKPLLYCSNSYGSTLVKATLKNNVLQYNMPLNITKKKGLVDWRLLNDNASIFGQFNIVAIQEASTMETYIGPPSIEAGGTDFSMLVVIPTDSLDNPLAENTLVSAKHQFLTLEKSETISVKNLIGYKNLYSKKESGRMLVSSESLGKNSKEFTINVMPAIPTDFIISVKRPHDYADGNQITSFSTSIIKDKYENIVSDGTFVTFYITNSKGNILKTTGTTINGIATSRIINPDYKDRWSIKAYIEGMAESNTLAVEYKQAIKDFNVVFYKNNRGIKVGPLQSFMKQMIPDGLQVKLLIYKNNSLLKTETKTAFNGYVAFDLKPGVFEDGDYDFKIQTAGIEKEFKNKKLW